MVEVIALRIGLRAGLCVSQESLGTQPPQLFAGQTMRVMNGQLLQSYTEPPSYLKESGV